MTAVCRVQDADGRGPFKPGFSHWWVEERADHDNLVPWLQQFGRVDRLVAVKRNMGCACKTLEQLRRWFTPSEYATLRRYGYQAVEMDVDRVLAESLIQCVFQRSKPLREDVRPFDLYVVATVGRGA